MAGACVRLMRVWLYAFAAASPQLPNILVCATNAFVDVLLLETVYALREGYVIEGEVVRDM